jgi:hypothetical protein
LGNHTGVKMAQSKPAHIRPGQPATASLMNKGVIKAIQTATSVGVGSGLEKRTVSGSVAITQREGIAPPQFAVASKKVQITAVLEDYLECVLYNERTETAQTQVIYVAKQRRFRPSLYDGVSITYLNGDVITYTKDATNPEWKRQADNGVTSVDQIPIPVWYIGEVIRVSQEATSAVTDPDGIQINWEEDEPREWAVI